MKYCGIDHCGYLYNIQKSLKIKKKKNKIHVVILFIYIKVTKYGNN